MLDEVTQRRYMMLVCNALCNVTSSVTRNVTCDVTVTVTPDVTVTDTVTLHDDEAAFLLRIPLHEYLVTKKILMEKGLINSCNLPIFVDGQKPKSAGAMRVAAYRARKKAQAAQAEAADDVTGVTPVTESVTSCTESVTEDVTSGVTCALQGENGQDSQDLSRALISDCFNVLFIKEKKNQKTENNPPHPPKSTTAKNELSTKKFELPDWIPADAWDGYLEMRKKIKKPMTPTAQNLAIKKLQALMTAGHAPRDVLEQSILNSWQGLFGVKNDENYQRGYNNRPEKLSVIDQVRVACGYDPVDNAPRRSGSTLDPDGRTVRRALDDPEWL